MSYTNEASQTRHLERLRSVIDKIDPSTGYPDWITVLMALFHETQGSGAGLLLANEWSSNGSNYKGFHDVEYRWNRFQLSHRRPVRMGTLVMLAKKYAKTNFH